MSGQFPHVSPRDREHIENKYHLTNEPFDGFKRMAYHGYAYDASTGLSDEEIRESAQRAHRSRDRRRP